MPARERSLRAEAIVLRHSDWGEADRILTLYTRQMGKVKGIAKGARKMRSRKAGHIEPFTHVDLQLARGRDLFIVTQAEALDPYLRLRDDLVRVGYASYIVELLDRFTYEEDENPSLFRLLADTLSRLNLAPDPTLPIRYYEIRLLDLLGYRPQLFKCANCEAEIQAEDQYFSASQGGVLCPKCGQTATDARPVSMQALKYLRHFQRSSYPQAMRARLTPSLNRELEQLMQYYLTYILERGLNTPAFLRYIKR
ncbi:MAG: DNA repair protein RecO [Anaerolineales bacterium]|jgi:DNA repair protein RecO (recombination protein O)